MLIWLIGIPVLLGTLGTSLFPVLFFLVANFFIIIPLEERSMEQQFGERYLDYEQLFGGGSEIEKRPRPVAMVWMVGVCGKLLAMAGKFLLGGWFLVDAAKLAEERERHVALLRSEVARLTGELQRLGAQKIVLFGSMAGGRLDLFTDVDLLVVMDSELPFVERSGWVYRELRPRVDADIFVYTEEEFETLKDGVFLRRALAEGVVLYEKKPS